MDGMHMISNTKCHKIHGIRSPRKKIINTNINHEQIILTPNKLKSRLPLTKLAEQTVLKYREEIKHILDFQDSRKMIVVGPCSIHDTEAALEYSHKLKNLAERVKDKLLLIMRVYFEKPRTTVGWKGLINDPDLNDSFDIEKGLFKARSLLLKIVELGLPTGTEVLDPIVPQYISELITWSAIGARTTESQTHREMASGLSMPAGFKNSTDGNIQVALNAMQSAILPHQFLGMNQIGQVSIFKTRGNAYSHIILRGSNSEPNFNAANVKFVEQQLKKNNLPPRIVIDCSHGNSNKNHKLQASVFENVIGQIMDGNSSIVGMMLESNLYEGNQKISSKEQLKYGVSITDKCIDWSETENLILAAYEKL